MQRDAGVTVQRYITPLKGGVCNVTVPRDTCNACNVTCNGTKEW